MKSKAVIAANLPIRRGLSADEAAIYIGIGPAKFREMVKDGRMPRPKKIDRSRVWDTAALDAAFRDLPDDGAKDTWGNV